VDKLGIGVVGCGNIAKVHLEQLVKQQNAALVGICDIVPERAAQVSAEYDVPGYTSYDELLARPEVNAVLIATPNYNHREATLQAFAAGKHVLVEKPMARTVRECDEMIAAAEAAGLKLGVGHVLRLMQPFSAILELIASGDFGRPRAIEMSRRSWWRKGATETWRSHRELMWGLLYEWTIHELDFMRAVCGDVAEVQAFVETLVHTERDAEDIDLVILRFQNGGLGLLRSSSFSTIPTTDGMIQCERGTIAWNWAKQRIEYRLADQPEPSVIQNDVGSFDVAGYGREQRAFVEWVLFDRVPVVGNRDGRAAIQLCEAAYLSGERRAPVALG
jgi:predicted dehydrogenase